MSKKQEIDAYVEETVALASMPLDDVLALIAENANVANERWGYPWSRFCKRVTAELGIPKAWAAADKRASRLRDKDAGQEAEDARRARETQATQGSKRSVKAALRKMDPEDAADMIADIIEDQPKAVKAKVRAKTVPKPMVTEDDTGPLAGALQDAADLAEHIDAMNEVRRGYRRLGDAPTPTGELLDVLLARLDEVEVAHRNLRAAWSDGSVTDEAIFALLDEAV